MGLPCSKRATKGDPGGSRVTPRDLLALRFIAEAQPVTTAQVRRLLGLSEDMAQRRLAVLRDHGLVRVHVEALHAPNRYTLAPGAAATLARLTGASADEIWVPRGIERLDLAHHEASIDVYVAVAVATTRSGQVRLVRWLFERELRKGAGAGAGVLVPDAVGVFAGPDGRHVAVAFEVDLGTENPSYVATNKGVAYGQLHAQGAPMAGTTAWTVACVVAAPERRLHRLALALAEAGVPERLWHLALLDALDDRTLLGPAWLTPLVDRARAGVTLAPSSPWEGVGTGVGTKGPDSSDRRNDDKPAFAVDRASDFSVALASEDVR